MCVCDYKVYCMRPNDYVYWTSTTYESRIRWCQIKRDRALEMHGVGKSGTNC